MHARTARPAWSPPGHGPVAQGRSTLDVRVNGEPERWLVAARLSRVSKKDRERGDALIDGIQTQDLRSAEWAQGEGHKIVKVTRDRNVSGAIAPWERPELGPWLTDPVLIVQYDGIVAYDVTRLSREYFDLAWLRKWAEANHKKLYVIKERLHWPDNRDGTLWCVAAERAYEERQEIIERVTRELGALRDAGKLTGRPSFGYASAGDKYDHYLVPTDTGRKYVPLIYRRCIDGWSLEKIAEWLNDEGVKTSSGGKWWGGTVGRFIIRNPAYMGHRCEWEVVPPDETEERDGTIVRYRYGSAWVENPRRQYGKTIHRCEELVNPAVWRDANAALDSRPKRGHIDPDNRAMLAEALYCPNCNYSPMYRIKGGDANNPFLYYRCAGRGSQRKGCGNMVRLELVDAAVNGIMAETFDVPVMRHEIVYGNEADIKAGLERVRFELRQLSAKELDWEEEDRERARLREEQQRIASTTLIEDTVELVETDDTYLELWERMSVQARGPWLAENGFRVTASKERVTVSQGSVTAWAKLDPPERKGPPQEEDFAFQGKCQCGCDEDVYGSPLGPARQYVNHTHQARAYRQRAAAREVSGLASDPQSVYFGKCQCGCGEDVYGTGIGQAKKYLNPNHQARAYRSRVATREEPPAQDTESVLLGKCQCGCGEDVYGSGRGKPKQYVNAAHQGRASRRRRAAAHREDQIPD
jgi:site-specific DNA recombinase